MSTDLEDKQGNQTSVSTPDPGQAYYDREFNGLTNPGNFSKNGTEPAQKLNELENSAGDTKSASTSSLGSKELKDAESLYNSRDSADYGLGFGGTAKLKSFFGDNKKKGIGGAIAGLVVGGGLFGMTIISGPMQFLHLAQTLQRFHLTNNNEFSDDRTSKVLLYALLGNTAKGRLGITSNKAADIYEKKLFDSTGMKPVYSQQTGRFVGYEMIKDDKALATLGNANEKDTAALERVAGKGAEFKRASELTGRQRIVGIDGQVRTGDTRILDLRNVSINDRRLINNLIGRQTQTSKIASVVGARLLAKRGGVDFHPLKNIQRKTNDNIFDRKQARKDQAAYNKQIKDARNTQARTGNIIAPGSIQAGGQDTDGDGKEDVSEEDAKAAGDTNQAIAEIKNADDSGLKAIKTGLSAAKGPAVVVGVLCAVKGISQSVDEYKYQNMMTMMRYGASYITVASQIMSGQGLNMDELGALNEDLRNEETGLGWDSARSIQAENGDALSGPDISPDAKPSKPGDDPLILGAVNAVPGLSPVCSVINFAGGLPIIKQVSDGISAITSGGINLALKPFGYTVDGLTQGAIALIAGKAVDLTATGPDAGNLANYGVRIMANDQAIANGGRALSDKEVAALDANQTEEPTKNIASRYLDPYLATSFTGMLIDKVPNSMSGWGISMSKAPLQLAAFPKTTFAFFNNRAGAAEATSYDYGFPEYGYSMDERNNPKFEDPYENAVIVESKLNDLNDKYGECFSTTVGTDGVITTGKSVNYEYLADHPECSDGSEDLLRYRFYLADTITAKSLACYEASDEAACTELGFGVPPEPDQAGPTSSIPGDIFGTSADQKCQIGSDGGIQDGYNRGTLVKIRICIVNGTDVNVKMEKSLDDLYKKASADGISLTAGGFRTMAEQQSLYDRNCRNGSCSPDTAKPGFSNHQMGLAFDFRYNGATICFKRSSANCNNNAGFDWLKANAANYGLRNLPKEAWHWSVDGR